MYGIFGYIYPINDPHVGKHTSTMDHLGSFVVGISPQKFVPGFYPVVVTLTSWKTGVESGRVSIRGGFG